MYVCNKYLWLLCIFSNLFQTFSMWVTMMVISCHNSSKIFYIIYIFRKSFYKCSNIFVDRRIYIYIYNPDQIYEITSSRLKINFILYLEIGRIERPNSRSVFNIWVIEITRNRDRFGLVLSYLLRCKSKITSDGEYYFLYNNRQSILYWRTLSSLSKDIQGAYRNVIQYFLTQMSWPIKKNFECNMNIQNFSYFQFLVY